MRTSVSEIKTFKACRRAWYLKYHEHLYPVQKAEALQIGTNYHEKLQALYESGDFEHDLTKESAMAEAYKKYIYPKFAVDAVEAEFLYKISDEHTLVGRTDGVNPQTGYLVEHKSTSKEITEQYEYDLMWDEQILAYMLATGSRKVWYTVCRKPTIRQKQNETDEEFYQRMVEWYDTDTDTKIRLLNIERSDEEVRQYAEDLEAICDEIDQARNYYRNTGWCNVYGRRCEYSSICLQYDPHAEYVEFERKERFADGIKATE